MNLLGQIQAKVKVAKNLRNDFGKYNYRNVESIYEAVKPILQELECALIVSDDIVMIGDRFYIKATAQIKDKSGAIIGEATAFAREALDKKGMDSAQLTGSCSSYARKYALGGLLLLDDNKDIDSLDNSHAPTQKAKSANPLLELKQKIAKKLESAGIAKADFVEFFNFCECDKDSAEQLENLLDNGIDSAIKAFLEFNHTGGAI